MPIDTLTQLLALQLMKHGVAPRAGLDLRWGDIDLEAGRLSLRPRTLGSRDPQVDSRLLRVRQNAAGRVPARRVIATRTTGQKGAR